MFDVHLFQSLRRQKQLSAYEDHPLVEYALAGMDNQLFVSKYQLELPKKEEMQRFLAQQLREVGDRFR
jgi:hypothetical protein